MRGVEPLQQRIGPIAAAPVARRVGERRRSRKQQNRRREEGRKAAGDRPHDSRVRAALDRVQRDRGRNADGSARKARDGGGARGRGRQSGDQRGADRRQRDLATDAPRPIRVLPVQRRHHRPRRAPGARLAIGRLQRGGHAARAEPFVPLRRRGARRPCRHEPRSLRRPAGPGRAGGSRSAREGAAPGVAPRPVSSRPTTPRTVAACSPRAWRKARRPRRRPSACGVASHFATRTVPAAAFCSSRSPTARRARPSCSPGARTATP